MFNVTIDEIIEELQMDHPRSVASTCRLIAKLIRLLNSSELPTLKLVTRWRNICKIACENGCNDLIVEFFLSEEMIESLNERSNLRHWFCLLAKDIDDLYGNIIIRSEIIYRMKHNKPIIRIDLTSNSDDEK